MEEKLVKQETGWTRVGKALFPCDATLNTDSSFDTLLTAKIGEKVFYLDLYFDYFDTDNGEKITIQAQCIKEGIVEKIDYATRCGVCIGIQTENGEKINAVQELFFHSYDEATDVAVKVNEYSFSHSYWEGSWYEIYRGLFTPCYPYMLRFPVKPQQAWLIEEDGTCHIANRVIATIGEEYANVEYQGHNQKSYVGERKFMENIDTLWMGQESYSIVSTLQADDFSIEC